MGYTVHISYYKDNDIYNNGNRTLIARALYFVSVEGTGVLDL